MMFKIYQQKNKLYTLECYYYSRLRRNNIISHSASNLTEANLAQVLEGRVTDRQSEDVFVILKTGNRPVILG